MDKLTAKQIAILMWLKSKDYEIKWIAPAEDISQLYQMRLITSYLSGAGYMLSQEGEKVTDKILSLCNSPVKTFNTDLL